MRHVRKDLCRNQLVLKKQMILFHRSELLFLVFALADSSCPGQGPRSNERKACRVSHLRDHEINMNSTLAHSLTAFRPSATLGMKPQSLLIFYHF
jgi:hypothetical protein